MLESVCVYVRMHAYICVQTAGKLVVQATKTSQLSLHASPEAAPQGVDAKYDSEASTDNDDVPVVGIAARRVADDTLADAQRCIDASETGVMDMQLTGNVNV